MSIFFSSDSHIPTNVVEVGNEISQNSLNALTAAYPPITANNPVATSANLAGLMSAPSVTGSGSGYNQQYDINGNAFYFSTNFYPIELTFTANDGQSCIVPARYANCPVAGTVLSSPAINYGSVGNQIYGFNGQGQDNGQPMYQFTQTEGLTANGDCTTFSSGGWPAADQDFGCDQWGSATTFYFSGENWTWRTDGSGGGQWYQLSGPPSCSGDTGSTSARDATIYINELGGWYTAGFYNTKEIYNSDCTTYWEDTDGPNWYENGTYITANGDYTYYSNGTGGYYSSYTGGGNQCPTNGEFAYNSGDYNYYHDGNCGYYQGEYTGGGGGGPSYNEGDPTGNTSSRDEIVYVYPLNNSYALGTVPTAEYYHSDGSTYWSDNGSVTWNPAGTLIGNDGMLDWYTDGNGGYTNTP